VEKVGMTEWGLIEKVLTRNNLPLPHNEQGKLEIPDGCYQAWAEALRQTAKNQPTCLEFGIQDLLNGLEALDDIKLGLLTGNSYWRSEVKLEFGGIDSYFRDRTGALLGAFGNEARTREGLISFAEDRLVFLHDQLIIIDDSILGAEMVRDHNLVGILVATGSAKADDLRQYSSHVFENFGENRWQQVVKLIDEA
jgi:phosphoglycolate phosphatase-like HAD superfamily hydrolase